MTIEVQISNKDATRTLAVTQLEYERSSGVKMFPKEVVEIAPGCTYTFHVHLLRELVISERTP